MAIVNMKVQGKDYVEHMNSNLPIDLATLHKSYQFPCISHESNAFLCSNPLGLQVAAKIRAMHLLKRNIELQRE